MKVFQIVGGFCFYDATRLYYNAAAAAKHYPPDIVWVDAPNYVFEGWGYDDTKEGDGRFIQPSPPVGWAYDPKTGSFYESGETPPSERPTLESMMAADIDGMTVDHEYRLTLLELGLAADSESV